MSWCSWQLLPSSTAGTPPHPLQVCFYSALQKKTQLCSRFTLMDFSFCMSLFAEHLWYYLYYFFRHKFPPSLKAEIQATVIPFLAFLIDGTYLQILTATCSILLASNIYRGLQGVVKGKAWKMCLYIRWMELFPVLSKFTCWAPICRVITCCSYLSASICL